MDVVQRVGRNFEPFSGGEILLVLIEVERDAALNNQAFALSGITDREILGVGFIMAEHNVAAMRAKVEDV
tara:strand:+ start:665 stop:874 length:210 start_codon:yes stop_codon:yes gene_type:complete